jgi:hypothetical protein
MIQAHTTRLLSCALFMLICFMYSESSTRVRAQKQPANNKPWQEVVSSEGQFRVLLPETPSEMFLPISGQFVRTDVRVFAVKSPVAIYAVLFWDVPSESSDAETIRAAFDNGRERAISEGKLILVKEKDISSAGTFAHEYILNDGAFVFRTRVYYTKGRFYQTIFSNPGLNGMPAGMDQYFDGLAAKFLNSFKIGA